MRIFFIGAVEFSRRALLKVLACGGDVVGVATKERSPFNADHVDLAPLCREKGIPCLHAADLNAPGTVAWIRGTKPDVIFCFGWSHLLRTDVLGLAPLGVVGFHPAALPANRGRHPLIWTLALGLEEGATTFFFMDAGADTGDILSQSRFAVAYDDDAGSLYGKMCRAAEAQISDFLPRLSAGTHERRPQSGAGNTWRKRGAPDGAIDFRMSSRSIYNLVRALTRPYPGAHVVWNGAEIKVWKAREAGNHPSNLEPGKVLRREEGVLRVKTGDGAIDLVEHGFIPPPPEGTYL